MFACFKADFWKGKWHVWLAICPDESWPNNFCKNWLSFVTVTSDVTFLQPLHPSVTFLISNYNHWLKLGGLSLSFLSVCLFVFYSILIYKVTFFSVHSSGFTTTVWISQHHQRADGIVHSVQPIWSEEAPERISILCHIGFLQQFDSSSLLNIRFMHKL